MCSSDLSASYGNVKVGKGFQVQSVGQVSLRGGDTGYGFAKLTLAGVPDEEWLREFFAEREPKRP